MRILRLYSASLQLNAKKPVITVSAIRPVVNFATLQEIQPVLATDDNAGKDNLTKHYGCVTGGKQARTSRGKAWGALHATSPSRNTLLMMSSRE
jgi:hypothetical protein